MDPATFTSLDEHLFRVQAAIDRHGVFHMCVLGDQLLPDYQYTIGFVHLDHPELTMFGLDPDSGAAVLQHLTHDPLLPIELYPPGWPADQLRQAYARYEADLQVELRSFFAAVGA